MDASTPPAAGILPALRASTGPAHESLEQAVDIERRVADPAAYERLLQDFLGFYRPLEKHLAALTDWPSHGLDFTARRKTPWLEADLRALGWSDGQIGALPDCGHLPATPDTARGIGCLYVLEGATLGGRQITALMRHSPVPAGARSFFDSYGAQTGARWREFIGALENYARGLGEAGRVEIVRAAQETFACLHAWVVRDYTRHDPPG